MNILPSGLIAGLLLSLLVIFSPPAEAVTYAAGEPDGTPHLLTELTFNAPQPMASTTTAVQSNISAPGWTFWVLKGATLGVQATSSPDGVGTVDALEGSYPAPAPTGANYIGADYNVSALNTEDIYITFWAKMPGVKEGCKFVKIFGDHPSSTTGYADTTIYTDYTGADYGAIRQIAFGDGTSLANDSQNVINLRGVGTNIGRSSTTAVVQTPQNSWFTPEDWGTSWHYFRIHVKFNSGTTSQNEVPNGEYYLEIDGKVYVNATGLYNRNPLNGPINRIEFFGWAQSESQPFQVWYDDIRISTGGFMPQTLPNPPGHVAIN